MDYPDPYLGFNWTSEATVPVGVDAATSTFRVEKAQHASSGELIR